MKKKPTPYQRNPLDDLPRFSYAGAIPPQPEPLRLTMRGILAIAAVTLTAGWYGAGYLLSVAQ